MCGIFGCVGQSNVVNILLGKNAGKGFNPDGTPSLIIDLKFTVKTATKYKMNTHTIAKAITSFFSALKYSFM